MKIGIASDHGGYKLKLKIINFLNKQKYEVKDYGTDSEESVDYTDFAFNLCKNLINKNIDLGIAICKTGIGMSIACNKVKGIRCAKVDSIKDAYCSKNHNFANVISLNGTMSFYLVKKIIIEFLNSSNSKEERHIRRVNKITEYENEC